MNCIRSAILLVLLSSPAVAQSTAGKTSVFDALGNPVLTDVATQAELDAAVLSGGGVTLTSTYVGYGSGSNTVTGEAAFNYDAGNNILTAGNITATTLLSADKISLFEASGIGAQTLSFLAGSDYTTNRTITFFSSDIDMDVTFPNLGSWVVASTGTNSWSDGVTQTFNPNATSAGINVGLQAGDPSNPSNGDLWYDETANGGLGELTARIGGANVTLGAAGTGGTGDVVGPSTAVTDSRVVLFDTTTGKLLKQGTILGTDLPSKATANTFTGDLTVPTEVYNATNWDADLTVPTKDAVRDVIETLQPLDADLTSIAALTTTAFGRGVLDDADAAALQTTAGVVIGTNVQAYDADLDDLADGSLTGSKVGTGISASNVTTGTLPDAQFPATLPAISGANLTNLDATDLATGTIPVARIGTGDIGPTQLTDTGVMAAAYTSANITVDADGRITAASNGSGGSGSVATDTIFDAKGDLPVGTAADTAAKLTVGANNTALIADSSTATGLKWAPLNDTVDYDKWHIGTYTFTSNTTIVGTNIISASASGTATADSDGSSTRLKNISYASAATTGSDAGFASNGGISHATHDWDVRWTGGIDTLTDVRWIGGLGEGISGVAAADLPAGSAAAWFRYSTSASDTNFQCLSDDDAAGSATITNSGVTATTGQFRFRITKTATAVTFFINGTQVAQHTATAAIPDKDASTIFVHRSRTLANAAATCYFTQAEIRHRVP